MSSPPPGVTRGSSFRRSLYPQGEGGGDDENAQGGMRRQRSRRRLSGRASSHNAGDRSTDPMAAAAAAAAAMSFDDEEPRRNVPRSGGGEDHSPNDRHSSWYTDALLQGGTEDLNAILSQVQDIPNQVGEESRSDEDEVLEQYRIMAHVEANIRVKDNTGFDMAEYEKRRKLQPEPTRGDYYTGNNKPKPKVPEPRLLGNSSAVLLPEEPPLPAARANRRFIEQRTPRVPELCPGTVVRGGQSHVPDGEHLVRCLGCKIQLRVPILASLVSCPDCSTVSPATSSRR